MTPSSIVPEPGLVSVGHPEGYEIGAEFLAIHENASRWCETVTNAVRRRDDVFEYDAKPEPVRTGFVDGFIPQTQGGYHARIGAVLGYARSSGPVPDCLHEWSAGVEYDGICQFSSDNGGPDFPDAFTPENLNAAWAWLNAALEADDTVRDLWWAFENEWFMDGCTYNYVVQCLYYETGNRKFGDEEPQLFFRVALELGNRTVFEVESLVPLDRIENAACGADAFMDALAREYCEKIGAI